MLQSIYATILKSEISLITVIQNRFEAAEPFIEIVEQVLNIRVLHLFILPFLILLSTKCFVYVMITTIFSHILAILFKCLLAEDRPFWWVNETNEYTYNRPHLRHTWLTCGATSGNPSSHIMMTCAVLHFLFTSPLKNSTLFNVCDLRTGAQKCITGLLSFAVIAVISLSQVYLARNFLHQCLFGAVFGVILSKRLNRFKLIERITECNKKAALIFGVSAIALAVVAYVGAHYYQRDPRWSIHKAFNWCRDPYFIKPEHTSTFFLVHDFGLLFGFLLCSPLHTRLDHQPDFKRGVTFIVSIVTSYYFLNTYIPRMNGVIIFYICVFLANIIFIVSLLKGVSYFRHISFLEKKKTS